MEITRVNLQNITDRLNQIFKLEFNLSSTIYLKDVDIVYKRSPLMQNNKGEIKISKSDLLNDQFAYAADWARTHGRFFKYMYINNTLLSDLKIERIYLDYSLFSLDNINDLNQDEFVWKMELDTEVIRKG